MGLMSMPPIGGTTPRKRLRLRREEVVEERRIAFTRADGACRTLCTRRKKLGRMGGHAYVAGFHAGALDIRHGEDGTQQRDGLRLGKPREQDAQGDQPRIEAEEVDPAINQNDFC
mmetsp:Transcript_21689/g.48866  ORF Transcript_21689/g.48866 Transcript_21689/m.48866 type:complete len:115 (+) Transcript_21689:721-1065(+)